MWRVEPIVQMKSNERQRAKYPELAQERVLCQKRFFIKTLNKHISTEAFCPHVLSLQLNSNQTGGSGNRLGKRRLTQSLL